MKLIQTSLHPSSVNVTETPH